MTAASEGATVALQDMVRATLDVIVRECFGIHPGAAPGPLEQVLPLVVRLTVTVVVVGMVCSAVFVWRSGDRPAARRLLRITVASAVGLPVVIGALQLSTITARTILTASGVGEPAAMSKLVTAADTPGAALLFVFFTSAQLTLVLCSMLVVVGLLIVIPFTAPGSVMPVARRRWWAMIAAIGVIVVSKPVAALCYAAALYALPDASPWGRMSVALGLLGATMMWPLLWGAFQSMLPESEPGDNGGGGGGGEGPDPLPDGGSPKGDAAKHKVPDLIWILPPTGGTHTSHGDSHAKEATQREH